MTNEPSNSESHFASESELTSVISEYEQELDREISTELAKKLLVEVDDEVIETYDQEVIVVAAVVFAYRHRYEETPTSLFSTIETSSETIEEVIDELLDEVGLRNDHEVVRQLQQQIRATQELLAAKRQHSADGVYMSLEQLIEEYGAALPPGAFAAEEFTYLSEDQLETHLERLEEDLRMSRLGVENYLLDSSALASADTEGDEDTDEQGERQDEQFD